MRLALRLALQARENLAAEIRSAPHDRDLPELLAEMRDTGLFTIPQLATLVGLSRSRTYGLLSEADAERDRQSPKA